MKNQKPLRTCLLALTHRGAGVTLIKTTETAPVIRKGQFIEVTGYGVTKVTEVRTEDAADCTLQWVSFNADGS